MDRLEEINVQMRALEAEKADLIIAQQRKEAEELANFAHLAQKILNLKTGGGWSVNFCQGTEDFNKMLRDTKGFYERFVECTLGDEADIEEVIVVLDSIIRGWSDPRPRG